MQQNSPGCQSRFACAKAGLDCGALVLDTNVVLDLLIFGDTHCEWLAVALAAQPGRWHATPRMRREFDAVLARPEFDRWASRRRHAADRWMDWATMVALAPPQAPTLRCRDTADQMFVDLAVQIGARGLLSRDRALLSLKARAARFGIQIATPAHVNRAQKKAAPPAAFDAARQH